MSGIDYIIIAVIALMIGGAGFAIYQSKKRGKKCIGCPDSAACSGNCACCSGKCSNH